MAAQTNDVANGDFLRAVAGPLAEGEHFHIAGFIGSPEVDPRWGGLRWRGANDCPTSDEDNNYFSVAVLDGPARKRSNFVRMFALVADDPELVPEGATWVLQTSAGKRQLGYALLDDEQSRDPALCAAALKAMAERGMFKADKSGNNIVRYVRLPKGTNTKYSPPFEHVLEQWHPERRFTLTQALAAFGIDVDSLSPLAEEETDTPAPGVDLFAAMGLLAKVSPDCSYHDWVTVGMALHHATGGSIAGLKMYDTWSAAAGPHYAGQAEVKAKWSSFGQYEGKPVTMASVEKLAREEHVLDDFADLGRPDVDVPFEQSEVAQAVAKGWGETPYDTLSVAPTEYLIEGFLAHSLMILAGQPGVGKTTALAALMMIVAGFTLGESPLTTPKRRKVLYVGEDLDQMKGILFAYAKAFGLHDIADWIILIEAHRAEKDDLLMLRHNVRRHRHGGEWPWLVLDTAAATMALESENDNSEVSTYMGSIKNKFFSRGVPVAISTHTNKSVGKDAADVMARGASAFTGDATLTATLSEEEGVHYMKLGKRRYVPDFVQIKLAPHTLVEHVTTRHGALQRKVLIYAVPEPASEAEREATKVDTKQAREHELTAQRAAKVRDWITDLLAIHGEVWMKRGSGGTKYPPEGCKGKVLTWAEVWDIGPVRKPMLDGPLKGAIWAEFEDFEGWGRLTPRVGGALW